MNRFQNIGFYCGIVYARERFEALKRNYATELDLDTIHKGDFPNFLDYALNNLEDAFFESGEIQSILLRRVFAYIPEAKKEKALTELKRSFENGAATTITEIFDANLVSLV
jgi:hypothetical protein